MTAMVVRVLARLIVDFSGHIGNFKTMVERNVVTLQGQARATFEAAKSGYEEITKKMDNQSIEMAKVITGAQDSFQAIKQDMEAIKTVSEVELTIIKDALNKLENDIRSSVGGVNTQLNSQGTWSGVN